MPRAVSPPTSTRELLLSALSQKPAIRLDGRAALDPRKLELEFVKEQPGTVECHFGKTKWAWHCVLEDNFVDVVGIQSACTSLSVDYQATSRSAV